MNVLADYSTSSKSEVITLEQWDRPNCLLFSDGGKHPPRDAQATNLSSTKEATPPSPSL